MDEKEYIELNNLLTKYRVVLFKEFLSSSILDSKRDSISRQIRSVDCLRNNMILKVEVERT